MIRIKESTVRILKGTHYSDGWLEMALTWPDALGRTGIQAFKERDIKFVYNSDKADIGFSKNGNKVRCVPRSKTILWKGEPPIYNLFFGLNLCNPNFLREFLEVMSVYKLDGLKQIHSNSPQNSFSFVSKYFGNNRDKFLCTVLRNKKFSSELNFFLFPEFKQNSLFSLREELDKTFSTFLGTEKYVSYGRGWDKECYRGILPLWDDKYKVFGEHKFCFAPENSMFNGYVTDKIINAMCCGSIPIYAGAPDVKKYLPCYSYIDATKYTPKELIENILTMPFSTYQKFRRTIKKFVTTEQSNMFSSYCFAEKIADIIEEKL